VARHLVDGLIAFDDDRAEPCRLGAVPNASTSPTRMMARVDVQMARAAAAIAARRRHRPRPR
jgi:hypothetical protein